MAKADRRVPLDATPATAAPAMIGTAGDGPDGPDVPDAHVVAGPAGPVADGGRTDPPTRAPVDGIPADAGAVDDARAVALARAVVAYRAVVPPRGPSYGGVRAACFALETTEGFHPDHLGSVAGGRAVLSWLADQLLRLPWRPSAPHGPAGAVAHPERPDDVAFPAFLHALLVVADLGLQGQVTPTTIRAMTRWADATVEGLRRDPRDALAQRDALRAVLGAVQVSRVHTTRSPNTAFRYLARSVAYALDAWTYAHHVSLTDAVVIDALLTLLARWGRANADAAAAEPTGVPSSPADVAVLAAAPLAAVRETALLVLAAVPTPTAPVAPPSLGASLATSPHAAAPAPAVSPTTRPLPRGGMAAVLTRRLEAEEDAWDALLAAHGVPDAHPAAADGTGDGALPGAGHDRDARPPDGSARADATAILTANPAFQTYVTTHHPADDGVLTFADDYAAIAADLAAQGRAGVMPPPRVVWDLGCAWGVQVLLLRAHCPALAYVGIDASLPLGVVPGAVTTIPWFVPPPAALGDADAPRTRYLLGRVPEALPTAGPAHAALRHATFISNMALGYGPTLGDPADVARALAAFGSGYVRAPRALTAALLDAFPCARVVRRASRHAPPLLHLAHRVGAR